MLEPSIVGSDLLSTIRARFSPCVDSVDIKNCTVNNMREKGVNRQILAHPLLVAAATSLISIDNVDFLALYC